jgi:hypothetical protein
MHVNLTNVSRKFHQCIPIWILQCGRFQRMHTHVAPKDQLEEGCDTDDGQTKRYPGPMVILPRTRFKP